MKHLTRLTLCVAVAAIAVSAHAQSGCTNSPENPTAILGLMGGAGAALVMLRDRIRGRRSS